MANEEESTPMEVTTAGTLELSAEAGERRVPAAGSTSWKLLLRNTQSGRRKVKLSISSDLTSECEGAPEWGVRLHDATGPIWESGPNAPESVEVLLEGTRPKELELEVVAPKGARYGDRVEVTLSFWHEDSGARGEARFVASARQSVLALKTSIGHEKNVADSVASKAKAGKSGIFALLAPTNLRGYVLIEGMNTDQLRETVKGIRRARGLVEGETTFEEIDHFLTPKPLVSGIMEGDVVELVAGPFKGEKARVQQIDESKEEITVELFEAMVPIPVTVRGDHVRVIEKER